jgi:hypothetical protein
MAVKFAKSYRLSSNSPDINGRPCWVQKVRKAENLYIFSQACKPDEKNFPYIQSFLVSVSPAGDLTEYGDDKVLGRISMTQEGGESRPTIEWVDGTNVTWIADP